jgi:PAS domain S-box-containing protein
MVGKKIEEVIGRDDTAILSPEEARYVMENDQQVVFSGETSSKEEVLTLANTPRTYLSTKAPYRDNHGKIIGIIGISRDITKRKQVEEQLREQATLLDKAQDAIVVRDLDHHLLYWNRSAERLYGWTAREALGRSVKELLYQDASEFHAATNAVLEKGEWIGEIQQYNRDGKALTIEGRWTLVRDDQGQPKSILAINTDVTERNKLKQQFLRAQRMERRSPAASRMTSTTCWPPF